MKKNKNTSLIAGFISCCMIFSCQPTEDPGNQSMNTEIEQKSELSEAFKKHWFDGNAEVASYDLTQMRYGEARKGTAVLIFVKEPFLKEEQVKANTASSNTIDVMKLNATRKFNTGIYPYSIMQSTFSPLSIDTHAIKVSASTQEWCGQTYMQLNNRDQFEITSHSYFEGEADQELQLDKQLLENEIWNKLRIDPKAIPSGKQKIIPGFAYFRLDHKEVMAYDAEITQSANNDTLVTSIRYNQLNRILNIYQSNKFPFTILKWEEKTSERGENFTKAVLQKQIRIDYWNKNSTTFAFLRDSLQLN